MELFLIENEFNKDETTKTIKNYIKKFGSIEKEDERSLFKGKLNKSSDSCPLKEEKKKYDFSRQLSIIHDYLNKSKTFSPKKKD